MGERKGCRDSGRLWSRLSGGREGRKGRWKKETGDSGCSCSCSCSCSCFCSWSWSCSCSCSCSCVCALFHLPLTVSRLFSSRQPLPIPSLPFPCLPFPSNRGCSEYLRKTLVEHYDWLAALSLMMRERQYQVSSVRLVGRPSVVWLVDLAARSVGRSVGTSVSGCIGRFDRYILYVPGRWVDALVR